MEQLRTVITAACLLSIAVGICNVLKPSKLFERQVRFLISLLFAICLAAPILHIDWTAAPAELAQTQMDHRTEQLTQEAQQLLLRAAESRAGSALRSILAENGITCPELQVTAHIDDEQCISISEVSAACSDAEKARELLRSDLGEGVTLHVAQLDENTAAQG